MEYKSKYEKWIENETECDLLRELQAISNDKKEIEETAHDKNGNPILNADGSNRTTTKTITVASDAKIDASSISFEKLQMSFSKDLSEGSAENFNLADIFGENAGVVAAALEGGKEFTVIDANGNEYAAEFDETGGVIQIGGQILENAAFIQRVSHQMRHVVRLRKLIYFNQKPRRNFRQNNFFLLPANLVFYAIYHRFRYVFHCHRLISEI